MVANQRFVYVIESTIQPGRIYTGLAADVGARLAAHSQETTANTPTTPDVLEATGRVTRLLTGGTWHDAAPIRGGAAYRLAGVKVTTIVAVAPW